MDKGGKPSAKPKTKVKKETNLYDRRILPPHLQNNNYNDVLIIGACCDSSDVDEFRSTVSQIAGTDVVIDVLLLTEKQCQDKDGSIKRSTLAMFYFTRNSSQIYAKISGDKNFRDLLYGQRIIPVYSDRKENLDLPMSASVAAPLMYYRKDSEFKKAVQTLLKKHQNTRLQRQGMHEDEERQFLKERDHQHPAKTPDREQPTTCIYFANVQNVQIGDGNIVISKTSESDSENKTFSNEDLYGTKQLNIRNGDFGDVSLPFDTQGQRVGNENDENHISTRFRQTLLTSNPENNICNEVNSNTFGSNIPFESNIQSKPSQDGFSTSNTSRPDLSSSVEQISSPTSRKNVHINSFTSRSDKSMLNRQSIEGWEGSRQEFKPTNDSEDIHFNVRDSNIHSESNIPPRDTPYISDSTQPFEMHSGFPLPQSVKWNLPMSSCDNNSISERDDTDCENNTTSFRSSSDMNSFPKPTPIPELSPFTSLFGSGTPSSTSPLSNVSTLPSIDGDSPNISYGSSLSLPLHQSPSLNDSLMTENFLKKKENHSKK